VTGLDGGRSERVSYRDAGAAQRAATARANQLADRPTAADRCVLDAVFALTTTYSKLTEFVYVEQVAELAGVHRVTAGESIRKLAAAGVIVWVPGRGRRSKSLIGVHDATRKKEAAVTSLSEDGKGSREEPEKEVTVTSPTRREQENEKKAKTLVKEKAVSSALGASSARSRARTTSAIAEVAAPAAGISLEEKSKSYEKSLDPYLALVAAADGGAAGDDAADATAIGGADQDADVRTFEPERGVDPLPTAAPRPPELVALFNGLPGAELNEGTMVRAAELYAIDATVIRGVFDRASTKNNPAAYAHTALSRITEDELAAPARAPGAASSTAPDLEKLESNARTTIARLRPQYPPDDLRLEILDQFKSLDEATVDALLAEDVGRAPDGPAPKRTAGDEGIRFADLRVAERDADEHDADEVDDAQVDDKEPDDPVDDPARSEQSSPWDGYRPPTRERIAQANAAIDSIKGRR